MLIRNALVATASLAALVCGSAFAADLPNRKSAQAPYLQPVPVFTWAGLYAGVNAGVSFGNNNNGGGAAAVFVPAGQTYNNYTTGNGSNRTGFTGGAQIGYNFQAGSFVYGVETDLQYRDRQNGGIGSTTNSPAIGVPYLLGAGGGSSSKYFGTVRGRLGYAIDRTLIYATGGFAYGGSTGSRTAVYNNNGAGLNGTANEYYTSGSNSNHLGYTLGGGVEYAITPNWTIKGEYLYVDLGHKSGGLSPTTVTPNNAYPVYLAGGSRNDRFSVLRAGLNYKF